MSEVVTPSANPHLAFFASCPRGMEPLLANELESLGALDVRPTGAGVHFSGPLLLAYAACLWSRVGNRVLLELGDFEMVDAESLYEGIRQRHWLDHLRPGGTFAVDFHGTGCGIDNSHFGALRVKDALVDQIREATGQRPGVDLQNPDLRLNVQLKKGRVKLGLDLSGTSLHQRGYRLGGGLAPLKENLAAALLYRAGWPEMADRGCPLMDPFCGSGTLLVEGALMAQDTAPGLLRRGFGFENWLGHDHQGWRDLLQEARERRRQGQERLLEIHGYDADPDAVNAARGNIRRAGVESHIRLTQRELSRLRPLTHKAGLPPGLMITNPPYGERLSERSLVSYLYRSLGETLKAFFPGWKLALFTARPELRPELGLHPEKKYKLRNGRLEAQLLLCSIRESPVESEPAAAGSDKGRARLAAATPSSPHSGNAGSIFANRLRKNQRKLAPWLRREGIQCYRVYDADMPEYAVAIDRYGDWVVVQEYAPPAKVDAEAARRRLDEVLAQVPEVLGVAPEHLVLKQRRRQTGRKQYQRQGDSNDLLEVKEGDARLLVNLRDYLDTGLFLDHRPLRRWLAARSEGRHFLNLFCYTGTASVLAGLGGARSTTSVDLSATYLDWARRNLALNGLSERLHRTERADVFRWLEGCRERFDLIFMDPPSFSNSKRMRGVLDVQKDHSDLIHGAMALLKEDGELVFSTNLRRFQLDADLEAAFSVDDLTRESLDPDFVRNPRIHRCWRFRHL